MLMSGEMSGYEPKALTLKQRFNRWYVCISAFLEFVNDELASY